MTIQRAVDEQRYRSPSRKNSDLYKATLRPDATAETRNKYVSYRNNYNRIKRAARLNYYKLQVEESKTNTKRLWQCY